MAALVIDDDEWKRSMSRLPDHLVLFYLARVPIASHGAMRQVCRAWNEMFRSKEIWDARRDSGVTEELLLLGSLVSGSLLRGSHRRRTNVFRDSYFEEGFTVWHGFESSTNSWFQLPAMPKDGRAARSVAFAAFDGNLFVIGGMLESSRTPCRNVTYFDVSRERCWKVGAPLNTTRANCMARIVDNALYVFGGFVKRDSPSTYPHEGRAASTRTVAVRTAEVFDRGTQSWRLVFNMTIPAQLDYGAVIDGKLFAIGTSGISLVSLQSRSNHNWTASPKVTGTVYDPRTNEWKNMERGLMHGWQKKTAIVNGRLYGCSICSRLKVLDSSKKELGKGES